jgi:hypothetical protein
VLAHFQDRAKTRRDRKIRADLVFAFSASMMISPRSRLTSRHWSDRISRGLHAVSSIATITACRCGLAALTSCCSVSSDSKRLFRGVSGSSVIADSAAADVHGALVIGEQVTAGAGERQDADGMA